MSSDMEDGESSDEAEVYVATHAENLLSAPFRAHFEEEMPAYHDQTKTLIESFCSVSTSLHVYFSHRMSTAEQRPRPMISGLTG